MILFYFHFNLHLRKYEDLIWCCFNVGTVSQTLSQKCSNIGGRYLVLVHMIKFTSRIFCWKWKKYHLDEWWQKYGNVIVSLDFPIEAWLNLFCLLYYLVVIVIDQLVHLALISHQCHTKSVFSSCVLFSKKASSNKNLMQAWNLLHGTKAEWGCF